jgi:transcriptional regulator with XRE-family HTH domain
MTPEELKAYREKHNMTQQELADALGVTRNAVNQQEMGIRPILRVTELALETIARNRKKTRKRK